MLSEKLGQQMLREAQAEAEDKTLQDLKFSFYDLETSTDIADLCRRIFFGINLAKHQSTEAIEIDRLLKVLAGLICSMQGQMTPKIVDQLEAHYLKCTEQVAGGQGEFELKNFAHALLLDKRPSRDQEIPSLVEIELMMQDGFPNQGLELIETISDDGNAKVTRLRIEALWLSGKLEQAILHCPAGDLKSDDREMRVIAWYQVFLPSIRDRNHFKLKKLVKTNFPELPPEFFVEYWLWSKSLGLKRDPFSLQGLRRRYGKLKENHPEAFEFFKAACVVESFSLRNDRRLNEMNEIRKVLSSQNSFASYRWQLLWFQAMAYQARACGFTNLADYCRSHYQNLSTQMSGGFTNDAYLAFLDWHIPQAIDMVANKKTSLSRGLSLTAAATKVISTVLQSRLKTYFSARENAERIRAQMLEDSAAILHENFSTMRGGLMKLAQLGTGIAWQFPFEIRDRLEDLCFSGKHLPFAKIQGIVDKDFPNNKDDFEGIYSTPLATGAIGQVHRLTHPSGPLVIKVKTPDALQQIDADLKLLSKLGWLLKTFARHDVQGFIDEWRNLLTAEGDLELEQRRMKKIYQFCQHHQDIVIPKLHEELCSPHVITMDFVEGQHLQTFLAESSQSDRDAAGQRIVKYFFTCLQGGLFWYDLHPGNFLFSKGHVGIVDFGAIAPELGERGAHILGWLAALEDGSVEAYKKHLATIKFIATEDYNYKFAIRSNQKLLMRPFLDDAPFTFTHEFSREVYDFLAFKDRNIGKFDVPTSQLPVIRVFLSLYSLLAQLGCTGNWYRIRKDVEDQLNKSA